MSLWKETSREQIFKTILFRIFKVGFRSEATGKAGHFDQLATKDWVNVVPLTKDGQVLLVRQFRYGIAEHTLEFPAGSIEAGQTPLEAVERELREETGGLGESIVQAGWCHPNPAFLTNRCFHFVARGVERKLQQSLDEHEEIEIVTLPVAEVERLIDTGVISHSLSVAAWYFFRRQEKAT